MTTPHLGRELSEADEVADYIIDEFAADNKGVAEVIPSDEIRSQLDALAEDGDGLDGTDMDDFYVDVKDAVLERGVIIA